MNIRTTEISHLKPVAYSCRQWRGCTRTHQGK